MPIDGAHKIAIALQCYSRLILYDGYEKPQKETNTAKQDDPKELWKRKREREKHFVRD